MIGTNIRGFRQLSRVCDSHAQVLIGFREKNPSICEVFKTTFQDEPVLAIFNGAFEMNYLNTSISDYETLANGLRKKKKSGNNNRLLLLNTNKIPLELSLLVCGIVLLPKDFDESYDNFLKTNSKLMVSLLDKYHVDLYETAFKLIYIYSNGSKNFFQWGVNLYLKHGISIHTIKFILTWNDIYKQLVKKLKKGTITAYTNKNELLDLLYELTTLRREKRANDAISSFNTAQKKLLRENELDEKAITILANFSKLSETKRLNFIKKVSTINDFNELMSHLRHVTSTHFEWDRKSFIDYMTNVDGLNCEIIFENDDVILVKVNDYETIKQLAKTTNWCISKNKSYWNNYISKRVGCNAQYMIFDFSKIEDDDLSIVGFTTTNNRGITAAHNFVNDDLMKGSGINLLTNINNSFLKFNAQKKNIFSILDTCGIDIFMVTNYEKPKYEWNCEDFLDHVYKVVDDENVTIIKNDGKQLVLSIFDENVGDIFGHTYYENQINIENKHIIFADFSKSVYDPNHIEYAVIDNSVHEEYCVNMFNSLSMSIMDNFENKLNEYGLPYDIIRRPYDNDCMALKAFKSLNTALLFKCVQTDKNCLNYIFKTIHADEVSDIIFNSIYDYASLDYLDVIYNNGLDVLSTIGYKPLKRIVINLFDFIQQNHQRVNGNTHLYSSSNIINKPSKDEIDSLYRGGINEVLTVKYLTVYLALKMIIKNEKKNLNLLRKIYSILFDLIKAYHLKGTLTDEFVLLMARYLVKDENDDFGDIIISYLNDNKEKNNEIKDALYEYCKKYKWVEEKVHMTKDGDNSLAYTFTVNITH